MSPLVPYGITHAVVFIVERAYYSHVSPVVVDVATHALVLSAHEDSCASRTVHIPCSDDNQPPTFILQFHPIDGPSDSNLPLRFVL